MMGWWGIRTQISLRTGTRRNRVPGSGPGGDAEVERNDPGEGGDHFGYTCVYGRKAMYLVPLLLDE